MLCVMAKLSAEANERLDILRHMAVPREHFLSPLYGHITLATYLPEDEGAFVRDCADMLRNARAFTVRYERVVLLPESSVIAAIPSKPAELVAMHLKIVSRYRAFLDQWTGRDDWLAHTTLLSDPKADLNAVCAAMRRHFVPFEARAEQIVFSRVEAEGYTILKTIDLV